MLYSELLVVRTLSNSSKIYRAAGVIFGGGGEDMYCTAQKSVQLLPHATTVLFKVNAKRILPELPTICVCQQTDKHLRTELLRKALFEICGHLGYYTATFGNYL
jgi:hypothetical protein